VAEKENGGHEGAEAKRSKKFPTQAATITGEKIISQTSCAVGEKDMLPGERGENGLVITRTRVNVQDV
jgi:hypothetical protein